MFDIDKMNHSCNVDKKQIPTCNIMGVNIAAINMDWLVDFTKENIKELSGDYMCVANVHTTVSAYEDEEYRVVQNGGVMAIPDGGPLSSVGRKRGFSDMSRTTGPGYMGEIFKISAREGYHHYFYGSTEETLRKMRENLEAKYPGITVAGMFSPPFGEVRPEDEAAWIQSINETHPDFVWVGLGAPRQEKWMANHKGEVEGFMVGVGAGFDYFAENIKRAPLWMQKANLEWFYRLMQEPKRLFSRYFKTNTKFIWEVMVKGK